MRQQVKLYKIKGNPLNPRVIKTDKFKKLVKSIQEFPEMLKLRPIIVDEDFMVLGGNMRLRASKDAGLKEVWIEVAEGFTEEQKKEFIVKDNVGFGEWEWDILANEWDSVQLAEWGLDVWENEDDKEPDSGLIEDDEIPEVKESIVKRGDIWQLGEHRVMCGDSTSSDDFEKLMKGEKADMVFTDPPYNLAYNGGTRKTKFDTLVNDDIDDYKWDDFINKSLKMIDVYCTGGVYLCIDWRKYADLYKKMEKHWRVYNCIVWAKNQLSMGMRYRFRHEFIIYADQPKGKWNGGHSETDVWEEKKDSYKDYKHPTQKPISLCLRAMENSKPKIILDAFLGSGSTLIACEKTNRKCYGMELDEKYCDVIINRWEQFTGLKAKKIN